MRRFRVRPDSIERKLRHERPQPTDELIHRISASIGTPAPKRRLNFAVAFAVTVAIFTAFALTGGVSYASSAAKHGAKAVSHIAFAQHSTHSAKQNGKSDDDKSGKSHKNGGSNEKGGKRGDDEHEHGNGNNGQHGDDHGDDDDDDEADDDQYREKVLICHKPGKHQHTIRVAQSAVAAHLAHGDTLGPCPKKQKKHDDDD